MRGAQLLQDGGAHGVPELMREGHRQTLWERLNSMLTLSTSSIHFLKIETVTVNIDKLSTINGPNWIVQFKNLVI